MSTNLPAAWNTPEVDVFDGGADVRDKATLIGQPMMVGKVTFNKGDYGPFASITAVDPANEEFVFNDGSTGVYRQVVGYLQDKGLINVDKPDTGEYNVRLVLRRGLRRSDYEGPGGKPAVTFYLA